MPKKRTNIIKKIEKSNIKLNRIIAESLPYTMISDGKGVKLKEKFDYEIIGINNNEAEIKLSAEIGFDPQKIFNIKIELIGTFHFSEVITEDKIKENISDLLNFMATEMSFIVSFITDKMFGKPYIFPPIVELKE
ncbi:MAG TPA: hypothetical protein GX516_08225 [Thermoanaerobacter sp.]|nr:hypothetical protein [Thermoanaerobacter sp.]